MNTTSDLASLDRFISSFQDYKSGKIDKPVSIEEIQAWLDGSDSFIEDLYDREVYDLYLDKFVDEYWKSCV